MKYIYSFLVMFLFINTVYSQDFEQTLDRATMDNFIVIEDRLLDLKQESEQKIECIDEYMFLMDVLNWYLHIQDWSDEEDNIKVFMDYALEIEQPEIVTQLFDEYHIENGFTKFVIASCIACTLIYENIFSGKSPELLAYLKAENGDFDEKYIDTNLETVNRYLSFFNDNDVALVREYMDAIMQDTISDFE